MFNRTWFNLTTFNRPLFTYVYVSTLLEGLGEVYPSAVIEAVGAVLLEGRGSVDFTVSQGGEVLLSGIGGLYIDAFKELYGDSFLEGIGTVYTHGNRYEVKVITFTGDFTVGDRIKIDMDNYTVTLNGENALDKTSGDFFNLRVGENDIIYTDGSTNRTVTITVDYRDRWL